MEFKDREFSTLARVVTQLFEQVRVLGHAGHALSGDFHASSPAGKAASTVLSRSKGRLAFLRTLYIALEELADLRFERDEQVLLYNRACWPKGEPIAKRSTDREPVRPSTMVNSYAGNWKLESSCGECSSRLIVGALYVRYRGNLTDAVLFLLDVYEQGLCVEPESITSALLVIVRIEALLGERGGPAAFEGVLDPVPARAADWSEVEFLADLVLPETAPAASVRRVLGALLERCLDSAERARQSAGYGPWLRAQVSIRFYSTLLSTITREFCYSAPATSEAILDQIEEMECDAYATTQGVRTKKASGLRGCFGLIGVPGGIAAFESKLGQNGRKRYLNERAQLPRVLEPFFAKGGRLESLPDAWRLAGDLECWPYATALTSDRVELVMLAFPSIPTRDFDQEAVVRMATEVNSLIVQGERGGGAAIEPRLRELLVEYPYNATIRRELAICCERAGRLDEAVTLLESAVLLNAEDGQSWRSLGVVLHRRGDEPEGKAILALSQYLDEARSR